MYDPGMPQNNVKVVKFKKGMVKWQMRRVKFTFCRK